MQSDFMKNLGEGVTPRCFNNNIVLDEGDSSITFLRGDVWHISI